MADKSCYTCKHFAELKEPWTRSDGAVIHGYCFSSGDKDHNPNMGKGIAVFIPDSGACKSHVRRRRKAENG